MTGARDAQDPGTGAAGQRRGESFHTACGATHRHHVPGPDGDGPAGEIAALAGREGGREHRFHRAVADSDLAWIDVGGGDLDEDLPLARRRSRDLGDVKDVDRAVPVELNSAAHAGSPGAGGGPLVSAAALPAAASSIIKMAVIATIR